MHLRTATFISLVSCLTFACGSSRDPGGSTGAQASTGQAGSTGAGSADPTETHASHASHTGDAGSTAATGESTETGSGSGGATTGATHGSDTSGTSTGGGGPSVEDYCICMLEHCHDQYHGTWGEEHRAAEAMCAAAAAALPSAGMPAARGDSLECRYHYCEIGEDEPGACESAIGGGACV